MAKLLKYYRLKNAKVSCITYDFQSGNVILPGQRAITFVSLSDCHLPVTSSCPLLKQSYISASKIKWNPHSPSFFAISRGQHLQIFEFQTSDSVKTITCQKKTEIHGHNKKIDDFSWCPTNTNWLVSCSRDQFATLWDVSRSEAVTTFRSVSPFSCCCWLFGNKSQSSHFDGLGRSKISLLGDVVVTAAESHLLFWDVRISVQPALVCRAHSQRIHALDIDNDHYQLVTAADGDSKMALWDVRNLGKQLSTVRLPLNNQSPQKIQFSPSGKMLLATRVVDLHPVTIDHSYAAVISLADCRYDMLPGCSDYVYDAVWTSADTVLTWSQDSCWRQFSLDQELSHANDKDSQQVLLTTINEQTIDSVRQRSVSANVTTTSDSIDLPLPPPLPEFAPETPILGVSKSLASTGSDKEPQIYQIPSPKTTVGRFCPAGFLVCLHRLYETKQKQPSIPAFVRSQSLKARGVSLSQNREIQNPTTTTNWPSAVLVYSTNSLLKLSRQMATKCRFDAKNAVLCCRQNAKLALSLGRPDLAQVLTAASLIASSTSGTVDIAKRVGVAALFRAVCNYMTQGCLQDAAIISFFLVPHYKQLGTVLSCYADQLYAWQLFDRRTELLQPLNAVLAGQLIAVEGHFQKMVHSCQSAPAKLGTVSTTVSTVSFDLSAKAAGQSQSVCSICTRPIRGLSTICLLCGHGGHTLHVRQFFTNSPQNKHKRIYCPTGCGCRCLFRFE